MLYTIFYSTQFVLKYQKGEKLVAQDLRQLLTHSTLMPGDPKVHKSGRDAKLNGMRGKVDLIVLVPTITIRCVTV